MGANPVAAERAPIPQGARILTRHIKSVGYFLKADIMGACKVPESAYYSHDKQGNPIDARYENAIVIVMRKDLRQCGLPTGMIGWGIRSVSSPTSTSGW